MARKRKVDSGVTVVCHSNNIVGFKGFANTTTI